MYIGASFKCDQFCQQDDKQKYDKSHIAHRHTIIDSKTFKQQNDMFIRKSKRAWNGFSIRLQSFFKKLKNQLNFIEKQAFNRLQLEQIKSAIKTQNKHLRNISMDVFQARYRNLTCQDIDQFLQLRKKNQGSEPIHIKRQQDQFAVDLNHQISNLIREMSEELAPKIERRNYRDEEDNKNNRRQRDNQREKDNNKQRDYHRDREVQRERGNHRDNRDRQNNKRNYRNQHERQPKRNQQKNEAIKERRPRREQREQYKKNLRERDEQNGKKETKKIVKQQKPKQRQPCPNLKIDQLKENCKAFDIDLKINNFIKNIYGKEMWRAFDETGQIMLVVPTHNAIKEGAKIRMHNCYVKLFNQKLQIYTKEYSKISYQNVKQQAFRFDQKSYKKHENSQKLKNNRQQKNLTKIEELSPDYQKFKLIAKVISVDIRKQSEKSCVLGDQTGIINAKFNGYDQLLKVGQILYFRGLEIEVDDCGHMFITGSKVLIQLAHDEVKSVKMSYNLSAREYQLVQ